MESIEYGMGPLQKLEKFLRCYRVSCKGLFLLIMLPTGSLHAKEEVHVKKEELSEESREVSSQKRRVFFSPSLLALALEALQKEDLEQAQSYIDQPTEKTPVQGRTWYHRGVIYEKMLRGKISSEKAPLLLQETITSYQKVLQLKPRLSQYYSFAAMRLSQLGMYYLDRGRRYYRREAWDEAIRQYAFCFQIDPQVADTYLYTAVAAHQSGKHALALQHYEKYFILQPKPAATAYRALATLLADSYKRWEKAFKVLENALYWYPYDNSLLYEQRKIFAAAEKDYLSHLRQRLRVLPHEPYAHYQLGYYYEQAGDTEEAQKYYRQASQCLSAPAAPWRQLGILRYQQAIQRIEEIRKLPEEKWEKEASTLEETLKQCLRQSLTYLQTAHRMDLTDRITLRLLKNIYRSLHLPQEGKITRMLKACNTPL